MRIIVDLDGTIYDLSSIWLQAYNRDYPEHTLTNEDILDWDVAKYAVCGTKIYDYLDDKELYLCGTIFPGAIETITDWYEEGIEVAIATRAMTAAAYMGKYEWVSKHLPNIPMFALTKDTKGWLQGDIFIDDGAHNLEQVNGLKFLYDQPHNRAIKNDQLIRMYDWEQIRNSVKVIYESSILR